MCIFLSLFLSGFARLSFAALYLSLQFFFIFILICFSCRHETPFRMLKVNNLKIKLVISCERDSKFLLFLEFYFPRVAVALLTADANIKKIEQLFLAIYWHIVYFSNTLLRTRQTFDYKIEKLLSLLCATACPLLDVPYVCMSIKIQLKKMVIKHFGSHSISNCALARFHLRVQRVVMAIRSVFNFTKISTHACSSTKQTTHNIVLSLRKLLYAINWQFLLRRCD